MFRLLEAHEINARVNQIFCTEKWKGVSILLYKDARCDMAILDEQYGINGWQNEYEMVGDQMFCTISIWDATKQQWIKKQSNGVESNMEAEKGRASDAFKRASFVVGIGRELYTAPNILVDCKGEGEITVKKDQYGKDKYICNCSFSVTDIGYDEHRNIDYLVISKTFKRATSECFTFGTKHPKRNYDPKPLALEPQTEPDTAEAKKTPQEYYEILCSKCNDKEKLNELLKLNGATKMSQLNGFVFHQVMRSINET